MNKETKTSAKRLEDEQEFHNKIFESDKRSREVGRFYEINGAIQEVYDNYVFNKPKDKVYLEYGCGMAKGRRLSKLAKEGALVHGIDISDYAIDFLRKEARDEGLDIDYQVMDAENMSFENNYFDVIYGTGILHHLDLNKAYSSISEKLKDDGTAIFIEPLGHNLLINGFRNKTPDIRTDDEHPLLMSDFDLARTYFKEVDIEYFYLTTLGVPLVFRKHQPKPLIDFFNRVDEILFKSLPFLRKHAWQVVLRLSQPV